MSGNGFHTQSEIDDGERLDSELAQALESYLAAVESGRSVDLERLAAEHPAIADQLRSCLGVLRLAERVEGDAGADRASDTGDGTAQPAQLGDFRLLRPIGRGGMGVVYEAEQLSLRRRVALKVLPFAGALDPHQLQRFETEAQAAAQLHHTNIVPVFSVGCERGVHYYAMQFIEGQTLAALIRDLRQSDQPDESMATERKDDLPTVASRLLSGELAPAEFMPSPHAGEGGPQGRMRGRPGAAASRPAGDASPSPSTRAYFRTVAQFGIQAAEALDYAHRMGIVHRDIKPANLLVDVRGTLWITDFGLARMQADVGLTVTGDFLGTLRYMSPEQALARRGVVDHRSDIYSLGSTLYELLTLRPAFPGQDRQELLHQITLEEPRPPRRLNRDVPIDLETIVLKAMSKDPESRYATARDLVDDLRRYLELKPIRARRPTLQDQATKWARRHSTEVVAAAFVLGLATVGLAIDYVRVAREQAMTSAALTRADARTRFAREAVDDMYTQVAEQWLKDQPHQTQLQREFLEKALKFYQALSLEQGEDPQVRREEGAAQVRVGDILAALGRTEEAEAAYRRALDIRTSLAADPRASGEDVLALGDNLRVVAASAWRRGIFSEAHDVFRRTLTMLDRWVAKHPDRADGRRSLAACYSDLGRLAGEEGKISVAESNYRRSIALYEESEPTTPLSPSDRQSLASVHFNLGTLCYEIPKRRQDALECYRRALSLYEVLASDFPGRQSYRAGAADARQAIANTLGNLGDRSQAEAEGVRALDDFQGLVRDFPDNFNYRHKLAVTHSILHHDKQAITEFEELVARFPSQHEYSADLGLMLANTGHGLFGHGEPEKALPILQRARSLIRVALQSSPRSPAYLRYLSLSSTWLAETLLHLCRYAEAAQIAEELAAIVPDGLDAANAAEILIRCTLMAQEDDHLSPVGREKAASAYAEQVRALIRQSERLSADQPEAQAALALLLANGPDRRFRDPGRAIELIKKAHGILPKDDRYWYMLGAALYRTGDVGGAIQAMKKRMELSSGGDGSDWFYLSMALWNQGDKDGARTWFAKAALWTDKNSPKDDTLRHLRSEAAAMFGLSDAPDPVQKDRDHSK
jgi:serine/threonine protein kinase/predicted Zn-dependent protease